MPQRNREPQCEDTEPRLSPSGFVDVENTPVLSHPALLAMKPSPSAKHDVQRPFRFLTHSVMRGALTHH
jgi:hypothetical protein